MMSHLRLTLLSVNDPRLSRQWKIKLEHEFNCFQKVHPVNHVFTAECCVALFIFIAQN